MGRGSGDQRITPEFSSRSANLLLESLERSIVGQTLHLAEVLDWPMSDKVISGATSNLEDKEQALEQLRGAMGEDELEDRQSIGHQMADAYQTLALEYFEKELDDDAQRTWDKSRSELKAAKVFPVVASETTHFCKQLDRDNQLRQRVAAQAIKIRAEYAPRQPLNFVLGDRLSQWAEDTQITDRTDEDNQSYLIDWSAVVERYFATETALAG